MMHVFCERKWYPKKKTLFNQEGFAPLPQGGRILPKEVHVKGKGMPLELL